MLRACAARMNLGIELDRALFLQVPELLHDGAKALCRAIGASKLGRLHEGHRRVRFRVEGGRWWRQPMTSHVDGSGRAVGP